MHKQTLRHKHGSRLIKHDIEKLRTILATTAKDMGGEAKNVLSDSYKNVKDKTDTLQANVADYVSEKPYKALALASFLGLACGLIMRRKRRIRSRH